VIRTFVELLNFRKVIDSVGNPDLLSLVQAEILKDPHAGTVIKGTGGLRKMRLASSSKGKSGGYRVLYVDFSEVSMVFLVAIYAKGKKEDISSDETAQIAQIIKLIRKELGL